MDSGYVTEISLINRGSGYTSAPSVTVQSPDVSVYYKKQIDLSSASVTTLLDGKTSAAAYLQLEEKSGSDSSILAQVPVTIQARIS
jgi:hypothetical protein